ncbi:MAG: M48 family metalloprotease [Proteobacteria bacterium]|jgi:hypothetical protein|nr:M48 family metalloprotease [Pseudomonadota bacterium]
METTPHISLRDFAETWRGEPYSHPEWAHPGSGLPPFIERLALRQRVEDVLDTVVALQRADWLQEGIYAGPQALGDVHRIILDCAKKLQIAVPPAIVSSCSNQDAFGTDTRAFLHLTSFHFQEHIPLEQRRFIAGRLCGHIAARQVTTNTLYSLIVDHHGLRSVARRSVGPALEFILAPLSLGVRLALSRWHRLAEITADRAGLLCAGSVDTSGRAMLRLALGINPAVDPEEYLEQIRTLGDEPSPGKWTELLASQPWMHKRMKALELFARSELFADATSDSLLSREELNQKTSELMGVV